MAVFNYPYRGPFRIGTILKEISADRRIKGIKPYSINDLITEALMEKYKKEIKQHVKEREEFTRSKK